MNAQAPVPRFRHDLTVILKSPFAVTAGVVSSSALDRTMARASDGRLIIPGTLIRGVLRDVALTLCEKHPEKLTRGLEPEAGGEGLQNLIAALFGRESASEKDDVSIGGFRQLNMPERRNLDIDDLVLKEATEDAGDGVITRVSIDVDLGAAREGHLQVIEQPYPVGTMVTFSGTVTVWGEVGDRLLGNIIEAARIMVPAIGGFKSAGFGKVEKISLQTRLDATAKTGGMTTDSRDLMVDLHIDRPFLVNAERAGSNIFKGSPMIPGGALKGALARHLFRDGAMDDAMEALLSQTRITHAFPRDTQTTKGEQTGLLNGHAIPLSLARVGLSGVCDVLLAGDNDEALTARSGDRPMSFRVDWKARDDCLVHRALGYSPVLIDYESRTRTAIEPRTGTASYDWDSNGGQLFVHLNVAPRPGLVFRTRLVGPVGYDEHWRLLQEALWRGVPGLGKTHAEFAAVAIESRGNAQSDPEPLFQSDGRASWALTLQTDAVLNNLDFLRQSRDIRADYAAYWMKEGFELIRFFATQRLAGGYIAIRYPQETDRYEPYLLTNRGSVFLIRETHAGKGASAMSGLFRSGLPANASIRHRDWRKFPYGPENGYGEIAFETALHAQFAIARRAED